MIRPREQTPCQQLAALNPRPPAPAPGMGAVTLPVIGTVPTWLVLVVAAALVYFLVLRKGGATRRRARRIIKRVTEY